MAAGALLSPVLNLSPKPVAANAISFWMMRSRSDRSFRHLGVALLFLALGMALIWHSRKGLDALPLRAETAPSMGGMARLRSQLSLATACLSGAATPVVGMIGVAGHMAHRMQEREMV